VAAVEILTTTVSTKGQVILPKAVRQRRNWAPGTRLLVEEIPDGVLLKAAPVFASTRPEEVAGMLAYPGRPQNNRGDGRSDSSGSEAASCSRSILTS
jgi:AbrB family looped-hinge helix DNA binding protein